MFEVSVCWVIVDFQTTVVVTIINKHWIAGIFDFFSKQWLKVKREFQRN
jgi:hypothetical protein